MTTCPTAEELNSLHKDHERLPQIRDELFATLRAEAKKAKELNWILPSDVEASSFTDLKLELVKNGLVVEDHTKYWRIYWSRKQESKAHPVPELKRTEGGLVGRDEALAMSQYAVAERELLHQLAEEKKKPGVSSMEWELPDGWWETQALYRLWNEVKKQGNKVQYKLSPDEFEMRMAVLVISWPASF